MLNFRQGAKKLLVWLERYQPGEVSKRRIATRLQFHPDTRKRHLVSTIVGPLKIRLDLRGCLNKDVYDLILTAATSSIAILAKARL
jgi:hypothetical protein